MANSLMTVGKAKCPVCKKRTMSRYGDIGIHVVKMKVCEGSEMPIVEGRK